MSSKCDTFNRNQSFFPPFFFCTIPSTPYGVCFGDTHIKPYPFSFSSAQRFFISSYGYSFTGLHMCSCDTAKYKRKGNTSNAQTLNVSSPLHMEASISNLCGQEEPFFLANTIATEEKNPPNKLPLSFSGRSQILANSGSSVKNKSAAKIVHFTLIPR